MTDENDNPEKRVTDAIEAELTDAVIIELAGLTPLEYTKKIRKAAKKHAVPMKMLDDLVKVAKIEKDADAVLEDHWAVKPAADAVNAILLLDNIIARIRKHVVMSTEAATVAALWIMLTWVHEHATYSPILMVTSAEANSGKSTLLGIIQFLARRALLSVAPSGAVLYRSIEKWSPTFVLDEADELFVENPDLRSIVNSGWTLGQSVLRCDPVTNEPMRFSTFCPKALGLKGKKLPDTTLSRTVIVEMKRKRAGESVGHYRHLDDVDFQDLRSRLARWAVDMGPALAGAVPPMPDGFLNRIASNWEMMLAIADSVSADAGAKARRAAIRIAKVVNAQKSTGTDLLIDIKTIYERDIALEMHVGSIPSLTLTKRLAEDPEKQWCEWGRAAKPITQKQLAKLLGEFGIHTKDVRVGGGTAVKSYTWASFLDAWERYLPPVADEEKDEDVGFDYSERRQRDNAHKSMACAENQSATEAPRRVSEIAPSQLKDKDYRGVADDKPEIASLAAADDPFAIPDFCERRRARAIGPPRDSLDDFG